MLAKCSFFSIKLKIKQEARKVFNNNKHVSVGLNRKQLALGVTAGLLGVVGMITSANAVNVNKDGTGQELIFPYYNAQAGYVTNVNIVNSTDDTKAIRIRFREGKSSKDVMDFNIYMSPNDVWTGSVSKDDSGSAKVTTNDKSCTLPTDFAPTCEEGKDCDPGSLVFAGGGVGAAETLEGYVEVFEMGVVDNPAIEAGVLHYNGSPSDCSVISKAWEKDTGTFWNGDSIKPPTGGIFGSSAILNVAEGTAFAVDPVALNGVFKTAQHTDPFDPVNYKFPSLASGDVMESSVTSNNGEALVVTKWKSSNSTECGLGGTVCNNNPYPVAHVLLAPHLMNEYFVDPTDGYDGHTDWVITNPMRKHGVFSGSGDLYVNFENGIFDREESRLLLEGVSPSAPTILEREVNVLSFVSNDHAYDRSRTVLSSPASKEVGVGNYLHGWARLSFGSADKEKTVSYSLGHYVEWGKRFGYYIQDAEVSQYDSVYSGVPAIGFAAIEGNVSDNANARFGDALPHKVQR
jgi:hypothetical protein